MKKIIIILDLKHPVTELAIATGIEKPNVSRYLNGKMAISVLFLKKIAKAYTAITYKEILQHLNERNLPLDTFEQLLNAGQVYVNIKDDEKEIIPVGKHAISKAAANAFEEWEGLPMYNVPITASFVAQYRDETYIEPQYYFRDPRFKDCDFGAIVTGDSMHSEIRHGDFVVCKEITDKSFIVFGEIYYIVAKNGLETCKYVNAGKDDETIMLVPRNEKISPSPINKDMILKMYKVRGIVRGY